MEKLVFLIKSYKRDFKDALKLILSIEKHNVENIPVYLSVNDEDYDFFKNNIPDSNVILLKDSDIIEVDIKDGWRYQQVVKSQFYRLNVCENYLCIDSDSFFIKDFYINDFMYDENTPYTIMHEAKPFLEMHEAIGLDSSNAVYKEGQQFMRKIFGTHGKDWDYGPPPYLWSTKVWRHFAEIFLAERNQTFIEFFKEIDKSISPSESNIYGEYLLKTKLIDIYPIEGYFKVYAYKKQFFMEKKYYKIDNLKKIYMGVSFQSNWVRKERRKIWKFWRSWN